MKTRKRFIFNIPESVYERLKYVAKERHMAKSVYVLQVIIEALAKEQL